MNFSEVELSDQRCHVSSMLLNRMIRTFAVPLFRIRTPQAGGDQAVRRGERRELRTEGTVVTEDAVNEDDRCALSLVPVRQWIVVGDLPLRVRWNRPPRLDFLSSSELRELKQGGNCDNND